jgi:hypothetical protein
METEEKNRRIRIKREGIRCRRVSIMPIEANSGDCDEGRICTKAILRDLGEMKNGQNTECTSGQDLNDDY